MEIRFKHILIIWLSFISAKLCAQNTQTLVYKTGEGLSANSVYRSVIDKKGFLWIATENGLNRFDGKKFEKYTTSKGLTDNEIIDLCMDSTGIIWAIPFRRTPCYYNAINDKFENENTDPQLDKINLGYAHKTHVLQFGGIAFSNNLHQLYIFKDGKTKEYLNTIDSGCGTILKVIEYQPDNFVIICEKRIIYLHSNGSITKQLPFHTLAMSVEYIDGHLFFFQETSITKRELDSTGRLGPPLVKEYPFPISIFCNTGKNIGITSITGNTYLVDKKTLELKEILYSGIHVRNILEDKDDNKWLSTIENGLIKIQQKRISSYTESAEMVQNFNTLIKTKYIIAGNNNGEIYVYDGLYKVRKVSLLKENVADAWIRKIIKTDKGIYVATQKGSFLFNEDCSILKKSFWGTDNKSSKTATLINDSILGLGSHAGVWKYNIRTGKFTDSIHKRVVALVADQVGKVYIGSNDGLYRWDKDTLFSFASLQKTFSYRVNTMACSPENLIWVGLASDSLLILKNDRLIASLALGDKLPGNTCKALYTNKPGEIWLGTNKGISKIEYALTDHSITYTTTYYGPSDGLIDEQVNDITINNDTVYVATTGGISYFPENISLPVADIPTFITRIVINGKEAELKESYTLPFNQNDITIEFSGVDLTGFIPLFEYSINNNKWQRTEKIELRRLSPGVYTIKIRAIKRNSQPSSHIEVVTIHIRTPLWKNFFFWALIILVSFGAMLYFIQNRNRERQKRMLEKVLTEKRIAELEMKALKAQINPHFVFNCLNSIKGFIYDRDFIQAEMYLDKFSELLRSTLDNADSSIISLEDEIKYLDNYLLLEKLRFANKFDYQISVSPSINQSAVFVPAMLLQPYVENAVRHGIRYLENKKGLIKIQVTSTHHHLICTIDDNGIGRAKAAAMKSAAHVEYQSKGMTISKRRAELYNIRLEVIDKLDTFNNATGTIVIVKIPLSLHP